MEASIADYGQAVGLTSWQNGQDRSPLRIGILPDPRPRAARSVPRPEEYELADRISEVSNYPPAHAY